MRHPVTITPWSSSCEHGSYLLHLSIRRARLRRERIAYEAEKARRFLDKLSDKLSLNAK